MVRSRTVYIILAGIVLLAFFLRVYRVSDIPPSLSWDEVSIGYNAFSVLKTGFDEHGRFLPLDTFVAYGDYKPPLPVYFTVPFVYLFGLNELSVRLPSVVAGTVSVLLMYIFVTGLVAAKTGKVKEGDRVTAGYEYGLTAAFLMAISPWNIQLSRAGFEANIALMLLMSGGCLIVQSTVKPVLLAFSLIPFVLSVYTFNSARIVAPLLAVLLAFMYRETVCRHLREFVIGAAVSALLLLPIVSHLISPEARLRFQEVNIFSDPAIVRTANSRIETGGNTLWAKILHNRRIGYAYAYVVHYFDNFEPWFLFIRGDGNPKFSLQDVGQLHGADLPFLLIGLFLLVRKRRKVFWLLVSWLIVAVIPAAAARETPHALRVENALPFYLTVTSFGIVGAVGNLKTRRKRIITVSVILLAYLVSVAYFLHNYFGFYPLEYSGEWQYGYREAVKYASRHYDGYDTIVITESIGRPYMYTLFYTGTDPSVFRSTKDAYFDAAGFYHVRGFGKYRFVYGDVGKYDGKTLYVLPAGVIPDGASRLEDITLLNGNTILTISGS